MPANGHHHPDAGLVYVPVQPTALCPQCVAENTMERSNGCLLVMKRCPHYVHVKMVDGRICMGFAVSKTLTEEDEGGNYHGRDKSIRGWR